MNVMSYWLDHRGQDVVDTELPKFHPQVKLFNKVVHEAVIDDIYMEAVLSFTADAIIPKYYDCKEIFEQIVLYSQINYVYSYASVENFMFDVKYWLLKIGDNWDPNTYRPQYLFYYKDNGGEKEYHHWAVFNHFKTFYSYIRAFTYRSMDDEIKQSLEDFLEKNRDEYIATPSPDKINTISCTNTLPYF